MPPCATSSWGRWTRSTAASTTWASSSARSSTPSCGRRRGRASTSSRSTSCPPQGSPICTGPAPGVHVKVVQDQAIRHAVSWAIDRETIDDGRLHRPAPPGDGDHLARATSPAATSRLVRQDPEIGYTYDPAKAHQVLEQGGWKCPPVGSDGICTKDGTKAEFTLDLRSSDSQQQQVRPAHQGVGGRRRHQDRPRHHHRGRAQRQDLQPDQLQGSRRRRQVRAHARRVHVGLGRRPDDARLRLRGAGVRQPVVRLVVVQPEYTALTKAALHEKDFRRSGSICCTRPSRSSSPHRPTSSTTYRPYMSVTRTDTWTNYQPSPQPIGQPFGVSWMQLQLIEPGDKASTSYAGTPWVIAFMVGDDRARRHRRLRAPPARGAPAVRAPRSRDDGSTGQVKPVLKKIAVALGTLRLRPRLQLLPVPHRRQPEERPDPRQPAAERGRPRAPDPPARARPGVPDAVSDLRRRHPPRRLRHELPDQPARLDDDVGGAAEHADPGRDLDAARHVHRVVARHLRGREPRLTRRHRRGADIALLLRDARLLGRHGPDLVLRRGGRASSQRARSRSPVRRSRRSATRGTSPSTRRSRSSRSRSGSSASTS